MRLTDKTVKHLDGKFSICFGDLNASLCNNLTSAAVTTSDNYRITVMKVARKPPGLLPVPQSPRLTTSIRAIKVKVKYGVILKPL